MADPSKTVQDLTAEIAVLNGRIEKMEAAEAERTRLEDALRNNQAGNRTLMERMNDILWTVDLELKITYVSPSVEKVLGFTVQERVKQPLEEQMPKEALTLAKGYMAEELACDGERDPERHIVLELDYYHKDGSIRCLETTLSFIRDDSGIPVGIHGLSRDITERKRAEEELRETNRLLQGVLDAVPDIIGIQNPDHTIIRYNKAGYEALNMTHEEVVGKTCFSLLGRTETCEHCATTLALNSKELEAIESFVPELGRHLLCRSNPILDDTGSVRLIIEQLHDITDRKQAEEALRESELQLRAITESAQDAILMMDVEGRVSYWNPAAARLFGYSSDEIIGRNLHYELASKRYHDAYEAAFPGFQQSGRGGAVGKTLQMTALRKTGEEFPIELSLSSVQLKDGWHAVGIVRDITNLQKVIEELKDKERDLAAESQRLLEMNTALKVLLQQRENDRQELENIFTSNIRSLVLPFIEKLKSSPLSAVQSDYVDIIDESLNDVLSPFLNTLTTTCHTFTPREIEVAHLVREGKTAKEIAVILNLSVRSIEFHKDKIRKKLGLTNTKVNLRTKLLSLEEGRVS